MSVRADPEYAGPRAATVGGVCPAILPSYRREEWHRYFPVKPPVVRKITGPAICFGTKQDMVFSSVVRYRGDNRLF